MRPSRVDTSEPACTKRKMLSTNSSTSWFCTSRKYSAIVSADSATRRRTPGGSSIWPNTSAAFSNTPDSIISRRRSVPSRVRSPTPANTDTPPCWLATRLIISVISTVLPTPAPPNRPILPPATYGVSRSMTLMPVSNMRADGSRASNSGAGRWMSQRSMSANSAGSLPTSRASPHTFHTWPSTRVAHRHLDAVAEAAHHRATRQAVGRLHADRPHAALTELLGDLGEHRHVRAVDVDLERQRVFELGQEAALELDVDDRPGDADDAAVGAGGPDVGWVSVMVMSLSCGRSCGSGQRACGTAACGRRAGRRSRRCRRRRRVGGCPRRRRAPRHR